MWGIPFDEDAYWGAAPGRVGKSRLVQKENPLG